MFQSEGVDSTKEDKVDKVEEPIPEGEAFINDARGMVVMDRLV